MAPDDIKEIKQALQDLAILTAKLKQAVDSNKEFQESMIKEVKEYVKEEKKENIRMRTECRLEINKQYDRHSVAITEHGKEIATLKESLKSVKNGYKSISSFIAILVTALINLFFGIFR